jgi:WD40 repeat protein
MAAALSPDGKLALIAYRNGGKPRLKVFLKLWDTTTGQVIRALPGHNDGVTFTAFLPGGRRAVSAGYDGTVRLFEIPTGRLLRSIDAHGGSISNACVSPDGRRLLTFGSADRADSRSDLKLWDLRTGKLVQTFPDPLTDGTSLAVSSDNRWVLSDSSASARGQVQLWDVGTGKTAQVFEAKGGWSGPVAFVPKSHYALTWFTTLAGNVRVSSELILWEVPNGKVVRSLQKVWWHGLPGFSRDGHQLTGVGISAASGTPLSREVVTWDLQNGRRVRSVKVWDPAKDADPSVNFSALSTDGSRALFVKGQNSERNRLYGPWIQVEVWDLKKGQLLQEWKDLTGFDN